MQLKPIEFDDCLSDSPWFRQNLHEHENVLSTAYKNIKNIEAQCRELISAAHKLSSAHRKFADTLCEFEFPTAGEQTDEERVIAGCLHQFGRVIIQVEDQRDGILEEAERLYIQPLKVFRCERIGKALNDDKKKFEKCSVKYYQSLDKHLNLSINKHKHNHLQDADAALDMQRRHFHQASLDYAFTLQAVQERMRFDFVKTLSAFLYSWLSFYHVGHVIHEDFKPNLDLVQIKIEKAKESFLVTEREAEVLKSRMLNTRPAAHACAERVPPVNQSIRQGYLYVMEKKNLQTQWTKYYCVYQRESRVFTMIPNTAVCKQNMKGTAAHSISMKLKSCTRRASDSIDKRFCFDIRTDRSTEPTTVQALSDDDRSLWLQALDGQEPIYSPNTGPPKQLQTALDNTGLDFISRCVRVVEETGGLIEQGLYRNCGVNSKVQKLLQLALDPQTQSSINLYDDEEWELRTLTSAIKTYLRSLPEPVMTYDLHAKFINAAKMDNTHERVNHMHYYVYQLPGDRFRILEIMIRHLRKVTDHSGTNLMSIGNLGVCFGPTLLRPKEESLAAIMDIKFCNVVVEVLIEYAEQIFSSRPPPTVGAPRPPKPEHTSTRLSIDTESLIPYQPCTSTVSRSVDHLNHTEQMNDLHDTRYSSPLSIQTNNTRDKRRTGGSRIIEPNDLNIYQEIAACQADTETQSSEGQNASVSHLTINNSCDSLTSVGSVVHCDSPSPNRTQHKRSVPANGNVQVNHVLMSMTPNHKAGRMSISYAPPYPGDIVTHLRSDNSVSVSHTALHSQNRASCNLAFMQPRRRVRTLYECTAGHDSELSFVPAQIVTNVYQSKEPGWLVGSLNGRTGLIPANYVEPLP